MKKTKAIAYFGSVAATAAALGISRQAVAAWKAVVPLDAAMAIMVLSDCTLVAEPKDYRLWGAARSTRR